MNKNLIHLLGLTTIILFLSSPAMAQWGGHGGGGGGHGGGFGGGGGYGGDHGGFGGGHDSGHTSSADARHDDRNHPNHAPGRAYGGGPIHPGTSAYNRARYGDWYHGNWHDHWGYGWHCGPVGWCAFGIGFGIGLAVWDAPWYWGYWPYYNPYYTQVIVVGSTPIDYSQPLVMARNPVGDPSLADSLAVQYLNAAKDAFMRGDYASAMTQVNLAIAQKPRDALLHEFRALILFATRQYKPAAAAIYAVLSIGPGWDWPTLVGMYPNADAYTAQLRSLEQYRNENLGSPEPRFLLAYHYMSCGFNDAAAAELREVVRLNSRDALSAQLLAALSGSKSASQPASAGPALPPQPVDAAALVGNWQASRPDGASFALNLGADKTYSWRYTQNGKPQEFTGAYSVADNLLILKQGGNATMIGQVTMLDGNRFNFKLAADNSADQGLTFTRR